MKNPIRDAQEFWSDAEIIAERPIARGIPLVLWSMAGLIVCAVVWSALAEIDEIVVARGKLVTTPATIVVQPFETSIIRAIDVRPGQVVKKGDRLGALDSTFASADSGELKGRLESYAAQIRRLDAESADAEFGTRAGTDESLQRKVFEERRSAHLAQLSKLEETIGQLKAGIVANQRDREILTKRLDSLREVEKMQEQLHAEALVTKLKVLESRDQRLSVERDLTLAVSNAEVLKRQLAAAQAEHLSAERDFKQKIAEEVVTVRREADALTERLSKAERRSELVALTAPADAVVLDVAKRSVGSVVREAEPLMTLVPLDAPLEAEVEIEATDVGLVRMGYPARLKLDAYPFQRHGIVNADLTTVSEDAFPRDGTTSGAKNQVQAPYFRARLNLGRNELRNLGTASRLLPGMTLAAEIVVGKRTVLTYLLYPVMKGFDEALREP